MEVVSVAPEDALVPTRKRWQGVEGSFDGASGCVLQRSMGPIDRTQQSDLTAGSDLERSAEHLVSLGELSAGRQALEGAVIAQGT